MLKIESPSERVFQESVRYKVDRQNFQEQKNFYSFEEDYLTDKADRFVFPYLCTDRHSKKNNNFFQLEFVVLRISLDYTEL